MDETSKNLRLVFSNTASFYDEIFEEISNLIFKFASFIKTSKGLEDPYSIQEKIDSIYYEIHKELESSPSEQIPVNIDSSLKELNEIIGRVNEHSKKSIFLERKIGDLTYFEDFVDYNGNEYTCYYPYLHTIGSYKNLKKYLNSQKNNTEFDINIRDTFFETALNRAIEHNDFDKLKLLIRYGAKLTTSLHVPYTNSLHQSIFSSHKIFKLICSYSKHMSFSVNLIENYLKKNIITDDTKKNLDYILKLVPTLKLLERSLDEVSVFLLEYALSNKNVRRFLARKYEYYHFNHYYHLIIYLIKDGKVILPLLKYIINFFPKKLFDVTSKRNQNSVRSLLNIIINLKADIVFHRLFITLIIKQTKITSLNKIRKTFKNLTKSPFSGLFLTNGTYPDTHMPNCFESDRFGNALISSLSLGQIEVSRLFMQYGAEIPKSAKSGEAYLNNIHKHPVMPTLPTPITSEGIVLLYKHGVNFFATNHKTRDNLLHAALRRGHPFISCVKTVYQILKTKKGFLNSQHDNSYLISAIWSGRLENVDFVIKNKLYSNSLICSRDLIQDITTQFQNLRLFRYESPLVNALTSNNINTIEFVINHHLYEKDEILLKNLARRGFFMKILPKTLDILLKNFPQLIKENSEDYGNFDIGYHILRDMNYTLFLHFFQNYPALKNISGYIYQLTNNPPDKEMFLKVLAIITNPKLKNYYRGNFLGSALYNNLPLEYLKLVLKNSAHLLGKKDVGTVSVSSPLAVAIFYNPDKCYSTIIHLLENYSKFIGRVLENDISIQKGINCPRLSLKQKLTIVKLLVEKLELNLFVMYNKYGKYLFISKVLESKDHRFLKQLHKKYNLDLNEKDENGNTPLHNTRDHQSLKFLLKNSKYDLTATNNKGETPFLIFCKENIFESSIEMLKLYKSHGYDIAKTMSDGEYPLFLAIKKTYGRMEVKTNFVKQAIHKLNVNINNKDIYGNNFLLSAASRKKIEDMLVLLEADLTNWDFNIQNKEGKNFLHLLFSNIAHKNTFPGMSFNNSSSMIRKLVVFLKKHNFNFLIKDKNGKTPYDYLKKTADTQILDVYQNLIN